MNWKEQQRVKVLKFVERGEIGGKEAAGLLGLSLRQARRLMAAYREEGVAAIAHGNRGRRPVHAIGEEVRELVVVLAQGRYAGCNQHHLTELLGERKGLGLSRSSVRRILVAAGIGIPRRRSAKHRCRRERYPREGMLLQIDGSRHDWLEGRAPYLTLLLREIVERKGVPGVLYSDRHGIFQRSPKEAETMEEQLEGRRHRAQFGRALEELGIQAIFALSPQAKGRVERLFGTLQHRLVSELRLAGASSIEVLKLAWDVTDHLCVKRLKRSCRSWWQC